MCEQEDQFELWLMDMDDALERFHATVPGESAEKLDFSADSLKNVEAFILRSYERVEDLRKPSEVLVWDGLTRYVGETFRKNLGGIWFIDYSDKKNAFYGLPQLKNMRGQSAQICPMTLVSASVDRRRGDFIYTVFENIRKRGEA
ncbi:hypothetical protein FXN63_13600 [Pigmentiphaga aceris]|uniref:Uncharacterized protein n=1 Tax=Pigmentiphaga aceris TaxID=1940612 RepID=A0A5C0B3M0_9BURK|nr:hypothetical protein FXN63_13600 [Pigmentiphaga aceris]